MNMGTVRKRMNYLKKKKKKTIEKHEVEERGQ